MHFLLRLRGAVDLDLVPQQYVLLTSHRSENVESRAFVECLSLLVSYIQTEHRLRVVWPIHPRTRQKLLELEIAPAATLIDPQGYLEFLALESHARLVLTDSGGVQEESCILGVPCVTVRKTTDRPETCTVGANELGGTDFGTMQKAVDKMLHCDRNWESPYGQEPSKAIVLALEEEFGDSSQQTEA